jgi:hypothetical protein
MTIPIDVAIGLACIAIVLGVFIGAAIGASRRGEPDSLSPQVIAAMREVEEWECPRLVEWDETTRAKFRAQQVARRVA